MVGSLFKARDAAGRADWAAHQIYIALGNFLTCAALLGIDTCPMEGIEPAKYDEILGLGALGLGTVVDAEREALDNERANAQLAGQRLIAAVELIKALGGGWNANPGLTQASATPEPALSKPN